MSDGTSEAFKAARRAVLDELAKESQDLGLYDTPKSELTQGTKYDNGKPTTSLLPSKPLLEIAKVLDYGAKKYAPHNWRKGIKYSRVLSAAQRHLMAWNDGEDLDPETNISHLAHAACNILFLLQYELSDKIDFDDRHHKGDKE